MTKRILFLSILALVVWMTTVMAANLIGPRIENQAILTGEEPLPEGAVIPWNPNLITDSPGTVIGTTTYDYQTNGSTGHRSVLDSQGGVHFDWMKGTGPNFPPATRAVYFNYVDSQGNWHTPEIGVNISQVNGDGYCQISKTSAGNAALAYHSSGGSSPAYVVYAVDNFPGMGIFSYFDPPDMLGLRCYWPYLTVDRNDNIHIVSCENNPELGGPQTLGYTRSVNGGEDWTALVRVDTVETISQNVVSSPVSDKVAIIYSHPQNFDTQWQNDIYYVESTDGLTWDFRQGKVNVTDYGTGGDSLFAYTDLAAVYDYNDNLNIFWNAQWVTDEGVYFHTFLLHYNSGNGSINVVTETDPAIDTLWATGNCQVSTTPSKPFGAWNRAITKMSAGVSNQDGINSVFALWTQFDPSDCSVEGWGNGDLYFSYTINGTDWTPAVNVTNSNSDGCAAGDCDSDHWSSLAERVDDSLHIVYINDKDAGGIPQTEGSVTDSPVMYLTVPNPLATGIDDNQKVPTSFALSQNYPNPFNAKTNINFKLENDSNVELSVFDITGAKVTTLVKGRVSAGDHTVNWDADNVASGVYYYSLKTNGEETAKKMTLLK